MSIVRPVRLDETPDEELRAEVWRRSLLRAEGKCTFCGHPFDSRPVCRFPERHRRHE